MATVETQNTNESEAVSSYTKTCEDVRNATSKSTDSCGDNTAANSNCSSAKQKRRRSDSDSDSEKESSKTSTIRCESKRLRHQEKLKTISNKTRPPNTEKIECGSRKGVVDMNCTDLDFEEQKPNPVPKRRKHNSRNEADTRGRKYLRSKTSTGVILLDNEGGKNECSSLSSTSSKKLLPAPGSDVHTEGNCSKVDEKTRKEIAEILEGISCGFLGLLVTMSERETVNGVLQRSFSSHDGKRTEKIESETYLKKKKRTEMRKNESVEKSGRRSEICRL